MLRTPPSGLIDLREAFPEARFHIAYATADNFTGVHLPGYGAPGAWLLEGAAASLREIVATWAEQGFGITIYDSYRPVRATEAMIAWCEANDHVWLLDDGYVSRNSRHNTGNAIDLSLWHRDSGEPVDMGTRFDHFHPDSHTLNAKGAVLANRLLLRDPMQAAGWQGYSKEWWHFNYVPLNGLPRLDVPYGVNED